MLGWIFGIFGLCIIALWMLALALTWTWAQKLEENQEPGVSWSEWLSIASIEWGAWVLLLLTFWRKPQTFFEAPPLAEVDMQRRDMTRQWPVIFVPSLHSTPAIFRILIYRLKKHFFTSLWIFDFPSFVRENDILEFELTQFISETLKRTGASRFRLVSFGTSRPFVARVLEAHFSESCDRWVCISGPAHASATLRLLKTKRLESVFSKPKSRREPDRLIVAKNDTLCYPPSVFGDDTNRRITIDRLGHYSVILQSEVTNQILEELR